jgi:hypothetical protein
MPFTFNADGTFATEPLGERGSRQPTAANLAELEDGDGGAVLSASLTLTDAQVKALGAISDLTLYPEIVPAPAAGTYILYLGGSLYFHSEGAYTGAGLGYVWVNQDGIDPGDVSNGVIVLNKASGDWVVQLSGPKQFEFELVEPAEVTGTIGALRLGSGFNTTPYGGGHADNTLTVSVMYAVLDL